jgi:uncharacterized repeat protein (TIGR02543 family)
MRKSFKKARMCGLLVMLIVFFSLVNCQNPINLLRPEGEIYPPETGSLSLLLGGQLGRTILPVVPVFQAFQLTFTGARNITINRCANTFSDPIHLPAGRYTLRVRAYTDAGRNHAAAWGSENNIIINSGEAIAHVVVLSPFFPDGQENGTFTWNISFPSGVTEARMHISPLSENGTAEMVFYFAGAGGTTPRSSSVSLASGFYSVLFTLTKPGFRTIQWLEVLHNHQNLVSSYVQHFDLEFFNNNNLTVTFIFNDGVTANVERSYSHGDLVMPISPQLRPTRDGYTFGGWFANANFSERWHFTTPLSRSRNLYLRWLSETCSNAEILGTFRGGVTLYGFIDVGEVILQLFSDNTARIQLTSFPGHTILASFSYRSIMRALHLSNISLHTSVMGRQAMERLTGDMPSELTLPVSRWSMDNGIFFSGNILSGNLYRNDSFTFSPDITFTEVTLNIEYPDASQSGRYVLTEMQFLDIAKPPVTLIGRLQGSRVTKRAEVLNDTALRSGTRVLVTSYLFNNIDGLNTSLGFVANRPALLMAGSQIAESTDNPWQPPAIFTLSMGGANNFTVRFPNRMNVRMNHANFTNNNPVVSWNPFPGANGYFVLGLLMRNNPGSPITPIFHHHTMQTSITASSLPALNPGDIVVVQVFALDRSGFLDTANMTGALFMETLTIVR